MNQKLLLGLRAISAIAVNTFREAVRNKIFGALLVFAAGVIAFSLVLGAMSLHHEVRVATNVGIFASTLFSSVITVYVSIDLLHTEIERRTIHTILSKPVHRWQFILGKFLGIIALMATIVLVLFGLSALLRSSLGGTVQPAFIWAFLCVYFQVVIVTAVALLFASFSSPLLSGLLTIGTFVLGHLHGQFGEVKNFFESSLLRSAIDFFEVLVPDLASLNLTFEVVQQISVPWDYVVSAGWYTCSYAGLVLLGAIVIFNYRDLG